MSKIFNMISKGQGKGAISGGSVEKVTPVQQLEIPLDLPPVDNDKEPVQMQRRSYKKAGGVPRTDAKDATIAGLREQISSLQKKIGQNEENDQHKNLVAVKREADATKQLLERTQMELEEAREWQAEPGAPKFRQRETELLGKIEKMTAESASVLSEFERVKGELAGLRSKHSELVKENDGARAELAEALIKLRQKEVEQPPGPEPAHKEAAAVAADTSAAMDAAARKNLLKGEARSGMAKRKFYYAAAVLLLLLSVAGFFYRGWAPSTALKLHAVSGEPGIGRVEHNIDLAETEAGLDLLVMPTTEAGWQDAGPAQDEPPGSSIARSDELSSSGVWPSFDVQGVKVEKTANACFVTFQSGLFVRDADFSEDGRTVLGSVAKALAPYSGELYLIVVGQTDLSADFGHDHGALAMNRAGVVKEILVSEAYFSEGSIVVRKAGAPSFSMPDTDDDMKNRNRTVDIRLVGKNSIVRE